MGAEEERSAEVEFFSSRKKASIAFSLSLSFSLFLVPFILFLVSVHARLIVRDPAEAKSAAPARAASAAGLRAEEAKPIGLDGGENKNGDEK